VTRQKLQPLTVRCQRVLCAKRHSRLHRRRTFQRTGYAHTICTALLSVSYLLCSSSNQIKSHYIIVRPEVDQRAGQLKSLLVSAVNSMVGREILAPGTIVRNMDGGGNILCKKNCLGEVTSKAIRFAGQLVSLVHRTYN